MLLCSIVSLRADSVAQKSADPSVEAQMKSFRVHPEFEINPFADETLGIANPVAIHWDQRGRLWVLTTLAYAQRKPGELPNDELLILEDRDGDGRADHSQVYADGLDMPIGFAIADGGIYLGEGDSLLFLPDVDGDDRADGREVVLRGFGEGDTHQNISNLTWGPDGCLYFSQGLHTYSRVETPWGIVRGDTAGFFRFDPRTHRLDPFCFPSMASQNPCGIVFDRRGAMFLKSNNRELIYVTPGLVPTIHSRNLVPVASIGATPGKSMGGEFVDSGHLPDWLQDHILIAGYYSHRMTAFPLVEEGSGFARVEPVELLSSEHSSFRPVDIRIGPDGAIYIADWFNPIIGHYQASLRHPDRDREHGRIWRLTAKGRPLLEEVPAFLSRAPWLPDEERLLAPTENLEDLSAFDRLRRVVQLSQQPSVDSMREALRVLDYPMDRFLDYALRQTVMALKDEWLPLLQDGKLDTFRPEHLAFALEACPVPEAVEIARERAGNPWLDTAIRQRFAAVLAKVGGPEDLRWLLDKGSPNADTLAALADAWALRKVRPAGPLAAQLKPLLEEENDQLRREAVRLAGLWQVSALGEVIGRIAFDDGSPVSLRGAALISFARIDPPGAGERIGDAFRRQALGPALWRPGMEALGLVDLPQAAATASFCLGIAETAEQVADLVAPLLSRKGGGEALASALEKAELSEQSADWIALALSSSGHSVPALSELLAEMRGAAGAGAGYSAEWVATLSKEVGADGDAEAGREVYRRAELTCTACHQVGGVGGILGPGLDTVGAGLPVDLLIESVLWPDRQLKEGYFAIRVTTRDGDVRVGYQESEQDGVLRLRDPATGDVSAIPLNQIADRENLGTLMPAGLTAGLSREELRDLIAYLASLKQ